MVEVVFRLNGKEVKTNAKLIVYNKSKTYKGELKKYAEYRLHVRRIIQHEENNTVIETKIKPGIYEATLVTGKKELYLGGVHLYRNNLIVLPKKFAKFYSDDVTIILTPVEETDERK